MDSMALSVQGMISMASSISISSTVTVNLQLDGLVVPSTASWDMLAAPSQYHKRRHAFFEFDLLAVFGGQCAEEHAGAVSADDYFLSDEVVHNAVVLIGGY